MGYLGAMSEGDRGEAALIGIPFDGTASFRPGARFGSQAIREASHSLETYSPFLNLDLAGRDYLDWGDLEIAPGSTERMIDATRERVTEAVERNLRTIVFGGEHTVSLGVVQVLAKQYPDLHVLQLDAHADYRDEYLGEKLSHATIMKRISEVLSPERIFRLGIRAGSREELEEAGIGTPLEYDPGQDVNEVVRKIPETAPLYVTLDMDAFDPSLVPGVGNPEPYGLTWREYIQLVRGLTFRNVIGFDVVELAPQYDTTGVSSVIAASAARELMLCLMK